jgi:hypothetical protein
LNGDQVQEWSSFFGTVAQIAITAFGVAFVVYQLKQPSWIGQTRKQFTSIYGLGEYWLAIIFSMGMLTPRAPWKIMSIVLGGVGLALVAAHWIVHWRLNRAGLAADPFDRRILRLSWVSILVYGAYLVGGIWALSAHHPSLLYVSATATVWLLISGTFEAWWHLRA